MKRSLSIYEKARGPDHTDVAVALENLAGVYRRQSRYADAEPLFKRSLAIFEEASRATTPTWQRHWTSWRNSTKIRAATPRQNLASSLLPQGQYAKAEPLFKRSLAIFEKVRGPEHIDVASSLRLLGALYRWQGRFTEAEPLIRRSLAIVEKVRGPEHIEVAYTLGILALVHLGRAGLQAQLGHLREGEKPRQRSRRHVPG